MPQLKIGWASRDVSTEKHVNIPGQFHARISEGVLDPVTITALAVDNGEDSVVFLSCDQASLRHHILEKVRLLAKGLDPSFPAEKLIINCTHTHTAPSYAPEKTSGDQTIMSGLSSLKTEIKIDSSQEYQDFLFGACAETAVKAWRERKAGGIAYGYGYAVVAHSRRVVYMDDVSTRPGYVGRPGIAVNGHAVMYGNTNDDMFSGYEAGADHFINLLYTFDEKGGLTGAIVNVPCPSQNSEMMHKLSASFWNETRRNIRAKHGNIFILPQCAAAGDLAPRILHYKQAQERRFKLKYGRERAFAEEFEREDIAERITNAFEEVLSWAKKDIRTEAAIRHRVENFVLPKRRILKEEYEAEKENLAELQKEPFATQGTPQERLVHDSQLVSRRTRCLNIMRRYETQDAEPTGDMEAHVVQVGDIAFATNRFELYMDFMHRIQARSPFEQTFIVQLTGIPQSIGGYLATVRGAENRGYSASLYCNQASPEGGQVIVDETVRILKELKAEDEKK